MDSWSHGGSVPSRRRGMWATQVVVVDSVVTVKVYSPSAVSGVASSRVTPSMHPMSSQSCPQARTSGRQPRKNEFLLIVGWYITGVFAATTRMECAESTLCGRRRQRPSLRRSLPARSLLAPCSLPARSLLAPCSLPPDAPPSRPVGEGPALVVEEQLGD